MLSGGRLSFSIFSSSSNYSMSLRLRSSDIISDSISSEASENGNEIENDELAKSSGRNSLTPESMEIPQSPIVSNYFSGSNNKFALKTMINLLNN